MLALKVKPPKLRAGTLAQPETHIPQKRKAGEATSSLFCAQNTGGRKRCVDFLAIEARIGYLEFALFLQTFKAFAGKVCEPLIEGLFGSLFEAAQEN